jgi:hypothetical protein
MSTPSSVADFEPGLILRALEAHHVRYVVIGAIAAIAAGAPIEAETLATADRWTLTTRVGDVDLTFLPAGTRGYRFFAPAKPDCTPCNAIYR